MTQNQKILKLSLVPPNAAKSTTKFSKRSVVGLALQETKELFLGGRHNEESASSFGISLL